MGLFGRLNQIGASHRGAPAVFVVGQGQLNAEGLCGRVQDAVDVHHGAGIPAFVLESFRGMKQIQVGLQVFAGADVPPACTLAVLRGGGEQIQKAFCIRVDDPVLDAVGFQAGGKPRDARRRF